MKKQICNSCFVIPGCKFGEISQGAFTLKDVLRGHAKDFRALVNEIEDEAVLFCVSKDKHFSSKPLSALSSSTFLIELLLTLEATPLCLGWILLRLQGSAMAFGHSLVRFSPQ